MKKLLILLLTIVLLLTSCNFITHPSDSIGNVLSAGESGKIKQMSTDILTCITENDKESFKKLFCEQVQNSEGFEDAVDEAFEYCKGTVYFTDITIDTSASGGSKWRDGERTYWSVDPDIPYFKVLTDIGSGDKEFRHYTIHYRLCIINEEDKTKEGLQYIKIELLNVDSIKIGE